jgi:AhpD family alkylhydroperoxidase
LARFARWFAKRRFGREPAPLDAFEHSNALLIAVSAFELAKERTRGLDPHLQALAELKTATIVRCAFCIDIGSALARKQGITERQVRELHEHRESSAFSTVEREVLEFATAMTETPAQSPHRVFEALREKLGDQGMVELAAAIAWENFRARMNHALGIQPQGFSEGAVCALPASAGPT